MASQFEHSGASAIIGIEPAEVLENERNELKLSQVKLLRESKHVLNYSFQGGKLYVISGQNGAGKSTLLQGLAGITPIAEGSITIGESQLSYKNWRNHQVWNKEALQRIQYVPQHVENMWLCGTIGQELSLIAKQYAAMGYNQVQEGLEKACSAFGIDSSLKERELLSLSLGEQKRMALGITFYLCGDWLLLDEPMAALDDEGKKLLLNELKARRQTGKGTIIVSHQLAELMLLADHHLHLTMEGLQEADKESELEAALFERLLQNDGQPNHEMLEAHRHMLRDPHDRDKQTSDLPNIFDPRSLMVSMMICSASLLIWNSWLSIGLYTLLAIAVTILLSREILRFSAILFGFLLMTLLLVLIGGISFSPFTFHIESAVSIAQRMLSLLVIIVLGLPLLSLMTPFRLQRSLQQSFAPIRKRLPVLDSYALLISLIFRFVPLLSGRWQALQALSRSRLKQARSFTWSMLPVLMLAYVRSILKMADQLATSLELRGYDRINRQPLLHAEVLWRKQDHWLIAIMTGLAVMNSAIHLFY